MRRENVRDDAGQCGGGARPRRWAMGAAMAAAAFCPLGQRRPHRNAPASPDGALAGDAALEHVPLEPADLVGASLAKHIAAAAGDRAGRPPCPHFLPWPPSQGVRA